MISVDECVRKIMIAATEKTERKLRASIEKKLCGSGRIMPNELLLVEQTDWLGRIEYRFPENKNTGGGE